MISHQGLRTFSATLIAVHFLAASLAGQGSRQLLGDVKHQIVASRNDLVALRRDIHRHPEASGQEERTARIIADRLSALGLDVREGVGGYGVVGVLRGEQPGPVVAFRADMDAVRSNAPDPVEFRSVIPGARHMCGHDIHTTIGLALAEGFSSVRQRLAGTILFVFQPAEESATGARAMIADGVFRDLMPAAIFAYHTSPLSVGQLATVPGTMMAGRDRVRVTIAGSGDLEAAAREVRSRIQSVSTIAPRQAVMPGPPGFVFAEVGEPSQSEAGAFAVSASITTADSRTRARTRQEIEEQLAEIERDGVTLSIDYQERFIAGVTNDPELVRQASASAGSILGTEAILNRDGVFPAYSEDFGSFQDVVPGVMFFLGVSNLQKGWVGMPHSPGYVADEESIFIGAGAMAAILLDRLVGGESQ
jgi:metal-dependent amidase/aminoacylase/carboxypeptidase family protein